MDRPQPMGQGTHKSKDLELSKETGAHVLRLLKLRSYANLEVRNFN